MSFFSLFSCFEIGILKLWIHRNLISRAIISISVVRVHIVFQSPYGVLFCYKCSRQVSGSGSFWFYFQHSKWDVFAWVLLQNIEFNLNWFLELWVARAWYVMETSTKYNRYAARIPKGMEVGWVGVVSSLSFDVQGQGWYCQIRTNSTDRRREVVQKLNVFHGCHKYMVPKCIIVHELQLPLCCFNLLKILWGHD